jgi:TPR repeat protein
LKINFINLSGNKDYQNAFKYWKMAADKGHSVAMRNIASLYKNGIGCEQNSMEYIRYSMM